MIHKQLPKVTSIQSALDTMHTIHPKVLLLQFTEMPELTGTTWNVVELFSGAGNVSRVFRESHRPVASFDKGIGGDCMDFTLAAGFLSVPQLQLRIPIYSNASVFAVHVWECKL